MSIKNKLICAIAISVLVCVLLSSCASTAKSSATAVLTQSPSSSKAPIESNGQMSIDELTTMVHTSIPSVNITDVVECRNYSSIENLTQTGRYYTISNSITITELYIAYDTALYNRLISANDKNRIGEVGYLILCDDLQIPLYYFDCESNCLFYALSQKGEDNGTWTSYNVWVYKDDDVNSEYNSIIRDAETKHQQTLADIANAEYKISGWITEFDLEYKYLLLSGTAIRADGTDEYSGDMRLDFNATDIDSLGVLSVGKKIELLGFSEADEGGTSDGYWFDYKMFNTENKASLGLKRHEIERRRAYLSRFIEFITNGGQNEDVPEATALPDEAAVLTAYSKLLTSSEDFGSDTFAQYFLYDINSDGTTDLIILSGTCEADAVLQVYTYIAGSPAFIGDISGSHCNLCGKTEGVGLTIHYGHMGSERICDVSFDREGLIIHELVTLHEVQEYTEFDYCIPIERYAINDLNALR